MHTLSDTGPAATAIDINDFSDYLQSGMVYIFEGISPSAFMYVCQTIIFESLDIGSSFSQIQYISMGYGSSS